MARIRQASELRGAASGLAIALLLVLSAFAPIEMVAQPPPTRNLEFKERSLLVRFKPGAAQAAINRVHRSVGAKAVRRFDIVDNLQHVRLPPGLPVKKAIGRYRSHPSVLYAEPDFLYQATPQLELTPNDTSFSDLWGLHNTGQTGGTSDADIDATEAWELTTGSESVVVFVIDSGGDYTHEDLADNRWTNPGEIAGNSTDDDGNGYVDDIYVIDPANADADPMDDNGHGTHVSGTIGAQGDNGKGVVGVNWDVNIGWCKFLDADGFGSTSDAVECLDYILDLENGGVNVVITNNSWGGAGFSQSLLDAVQAHRSNGILFAAAAGNAKLDTDAFRQYPSSYRAPNIIAVAATNDTDERCGYRGAGRRLGAGRTRRFAGSRSQSTGILSQEPPRV